MPTLRFIRRAAYLLFAASSCLFAGGCGEKTIPAKTEFTEQDKQQLQELQQQRLDEWGKPVK
jgi:hypothetical protein